MSYSNVTDKIQGNARKAERAILEIIKAQEATLQKIKELEASIKEENQAYNERIEELHHIFKHINFKLPFTMLHEARVYQILDSTFQYRILDVNHYLPDVESDTPKPPAPPEDRRLPEGGPVKPPRSFE
jgi:hypothetical protein